MNKNIFFPLDPPIPLTHNKSNLNQTRGGFTHAQALLYRGECVCLQFVTFDINHNRKLNTKIGKNYVGKPMHIENTKRSIPYNLA